MSRKLIFRSASFSKVNFRYVILFAVIIVPIIMDECSITKSVFEKFCMHTKGLMIMF
jgi:hypothetical protein